MKKIIIAIVVILAVVVGIFLLKSKPQSVDKIPVSGKVNVTPTTNLKSFTVERADLSSPQFVVIGYQLSRAEVWYVPTGSDLSSAKKFGDLELVESNAKGDQTWLLDVPQTQVQVDTVYVKGWDTAGKSVGELALSTTGKDSLTLELWPEVPHPALTGTIVSLTAKNFVLDVGKPIHAQITVTPESGVAVYDSKGKPTTYSKIKKGMNVTVLGKYTDDASFSANQIEANN